MIPVRQLILKVSAGQRVSHALTIIPQVSPPVRTVHPQEAVSLLWCLSVRGICLPSTDPLGREQPFLLPLLPLLPGLHSHPTPPPAMWGRYSLCPRPVVWGDVLPGTRLSLFSHKSTLPLVRDQSSFLRPRLWLITRWMVQHATRMPYWGWLTLALCSEDSVFSPFLVKPVFFLPAQIQPSSEDLWITSHLMWCILLWVPPQCDIIVLD